MPALAISLLVASFVSVVLVAYALRTVAVGRVSDERLARYGGTPFVNLWVMEAFYWLIRGVSRALVRMRVAPDTLTFVALVVSAASLPAAATGHFVIAGLLIVSGAVFDAFDGLVARARGMASDRGALLDSVIDRYADAAPLLGLAIFFRDEALGLAIPILAVLGGQMVSYVRAKAEAMELDLASTIMRRHERVGYLAAGLLLDPLFRDWLGFGTFALAVVALVALGSHYAAIVLTQRARRALAQMGRGPNEPA